jgi:ribosomal protein S27AE
MKKPPQCPNCGQFKSFQGWHIALFGGILACVFVVTAPIGILMLLAAPVAYASSKKTGKWTCSNCRNVFIAK